MTKFTKVLIASTFALAFAAPAFAAGEETTLLERNVYTNQTSATQSPAFDSFASAERGRHIVVGMDASDQINSGKDLSIKSQR